MFQLIVLQILIIVSNTELSCNGVEYLVDGVAVALPADVCISSWSNGAGSSSKYICSGSSIKLQSFSNAVCSGNPTSQINVCSNTEYTNCKSICKTKACEYINIETYTGVTSCSPITYSGYTSSGHVANYCVSNGDVSTKTICNSTHAIYSTYSDANCDNKNEADVYKLGEICYNMNFVYYAYKTTCGKAYDSAFMYSILIPFIVIFINFCFF
eukprot:405453_1